jgi:hypothetical protein
MAHLQDGKWVFLPVDTSLEQLQEEILDARKDEPEGNLSLPHWHFMPLDEVITFDSEWSEQLCAFV